ncbi:hypothetical protein ACFQL1_15565 [Halomicroarcula sp. GCM10025709]|uniref:hypothetical protein n=1 Tax=Haloarcula TaxID=2237 RepID=UPI0024C38EE7|nr:hypothetical protein [Halomicroarcula sp. YJ-61-S]
MNRPLDIGHVADTLPDLGEAIENPRLRPVGLVGGFVLLCLGAGLSVAPTAGRLALWANAVAATLVFVAVPLFCLGLAAPEPTGSRFQFGIDLTRRQRQAVAAGALCIVVAPIVMALGQPIGFALPVVLAAAGLAFVGSALVLTGFVAWTSQVLAEPGRA